LPVRIVEVIAHHKRWPIRKDPHKTACRYMALHYIFGQVRAVPQRVV